MKYINFIVTMHDESVVEIDVKNDVETVKIMMNNYGIETSTSINSNKITVKNHEDLEMILEFIDQYMIEM